MRVAAIDVGSNTVLLLVAESRADGTTIAVLERATITRLGEGVDRSRRLSPVAVKRTLVCLEHYAELARELGVERTIVVGTSAMRDAHGSDEMRSQIRALFGVDVRVLSGDEEARATFAGGVDGLRLPSGSRLGLFDIGGGSTEIVIGELRDRRPELSYVRSFDIGSVRLTERHVRSDPPTRIELEAITADVRDTLSDVGALPKDTVPVGVAGTITTLAAVAFGIAPYVGAEVHGRLLSTKELRRVIADLTAVDLNARKLIPGMEPNRADVIIAGGCIAAALLDLWGAEVVLVSDRGVRWGLVREMLA
jgi:exopolyphosphatase/guanosine-5'-triphosphate,3'-diphosphate pyrophosphatase